MKENESIFHQPLGEVMRKEISADFLKKEISLPRFLRKEINGGFLDTEIRFSRRDNYQTESKRTSDSPVVELTRCYSCGKPTPATVASCLHCGAHIEATYKKPEPGKEPEQTVNRARRYEQPKTLIDLAEDIL